LLLKALRPFTDEKGNERFINDEYYFMGPGTYIPRIEEEILKEIKATVIKPNTALVVRAKKPIKDFEGKLRRPGERWLVRLNGAYMPHEHEEIVEVRKAFVLTNKKCIHLKALKNLVDVYKIERKAG
jgi:major vault protein